MRPDQAVEFVERIRERTGSYPGFYGGENRLRKIFGGSQVSPAAKRVLGRCWLWVANYHEQPESIPPWGNWRMWQYTGDGVCDLPRSVYPKNIANMRNAERNIFRGGSSTLRTFWQEHGWNPAQ